MFTKYATEKHWGVEATARGWVAKSWAEWLEFYRGKSWAEEQREKSIEAP